MAYGGTTNTGNSTPGGTAGGVRGATGVARGGMTTRAGDTRNNNANIISSTIGTQLPGGGEILVPISTQVNLTQGYFSNNAGLLEGSNIHTGTLADANEKYYFNVTNTHPLSSSAEVQFSVAFGHIHGSGSVVLSGNETETLKGETQAVYNQVSSLVLKESEISGGLQISNQGTFNAAGGREDYIYTLVTKRTRYKDALDIKAWTIKLSGSNSAGAGTDVLSLTDDSGNDGTNVTQTIAGPRYNIVSGAAGTVVSASSARTFGHFYPHMGLMVFSGAELSASIPGYSDAAGKGIADITASFSANPADEAFQTASGFTPNLYNDGNPKNALKFVNCLRNIGSHDIRLRSSQEQEKRSYFCTVPVNDCNFSTNPTFVSESKNSSGITEAKLRHASMKMNPQVYISGVGLHATDGTLLAVAKLSTPVQKNFGTQQTIKVNLTY